MKKKAKPGSRRPARGSTTNRQKAKTRPKRPEAPLVYLRRDRRRKQIADEAARAADPALGEEGPPPERRERRSLSHVGGRIDVRGGEAELRAALEAALDVSDDDDASRAHVHGFH